MILGYKSELKAYYCITEAFLTTPSLEKITISCITIKYIRKLGDSPASEQRGEGRIDQSRIGAHANVETKKAEYKRSISKRVCFLEQRVWQEIGLFAAVRAAVLPIAQRQIPYSR